MRKLQRATAHPCVSQILLCPPPLGEVSLTHCVWICRVSVLLSKWQERRNCYSYPLNPRGYTHYYVHMHTPPILNLVPASHLVRTWSSYAICPPVLALIHPTNTPITLIKPRVQQKKKNAQCTHRHAHPPQWDPPVQGLGWTCGEVSVSVTMTNSDAQLVAFTNIAKHLTSLHTAWRKTVILCCEVVESPLPPPPLQNHLSTSSQ